MKRLRLTPEAERDVDAAHLWYHRQAPDRAAAFLAAVSACLATIQSHPQAFALVDSTVRRALIRRFPYAIFYEIEPPRNGVMMQVLVKRGGAWTIVAVQNTNVRNEAERRP